MSDLQQILTLIFLSVLWASYWTIRDSRFDALDYLLGLSGIESADVIVHWVVLGDGIDNPASTGK